MSITLTVNGSALKRELIRSISRHNNSNQVKNSLMVGNQKLITKFEVMKKQMIKEFLNLPITKEIQGGPSASNISGTLKGYGNLFSFIGFNKTDSPLDPIINLLNQSYIRVGKSNPRGQVLVSIEIPSAKQIFESTPLPWATGISWAQRIEVGMSGLGYYLNTQHPGGRSGVGVQIQGKVRAGGFSNKPYISSFIKTWKDRFLKIEKNIKL